MIRALLIAAAAASVAPPSTNVTSLILTERAFSAAAEKSGVPAAFRRYAAPGGIVFTDKPTPVRTAYPSDEKDGSSLVWQPSVAGVAASGELGYDMGPWTSTDAKGQKSHGWFFKIWGVQGDRTWRFLADNGVVTGDGDAPAAPTDVTIIPPGMTGDASNAFGRVEMAEIAIGQGQSGLTSRALAPDGWVLRMGHEAATGKAALALAAKDPRIGYRTLGGGVSGAGDLAYMFGSATWAGGRGHYLRVWQRRAGTWKVLIDSLVPVTPAKG